LTDYSPAAASGGALLRAEGLSFAYKDSPPLFSDIDLAVSAGEIVGLTGDSGCGKTTLCHCLCGIIPHIYSSGTMSGSVTLLGEDISGKRQAELCRDINIVFQDPDIQLFSSTVADDIAFGLENMCMPRDEMQERIDRVARLLGIEALLSKNPNRLSGGQKQLCAIACVLVLEPSVLIFDEALSRLDTAGRRAVLDAAERLRADGRSIIMIEHRSENLRCADRVLRLEGGHLSR